MMHDSLVTLKESVKDFSSSRSDKTSATVVYSWGAGYSGQLGIELKRGTPKSRMSPYAVVFPDNVSICQVACGASHTACLTESGQLYTWGNGARGQLGLILGNIKTSPLPVKVDTFPPGTPIITQISCGDNHTVVVDVTGALWTWGHGSSGQLGLWGHSNQVTPQRIQVPGVAFKQAVAGASHTAALSRPGYVYTWGLAEHGQLGHGESGPGVHLVKPKMVEALKNDAITDIYCGATATAAITMDGDLLMWGFGEHFFPSKITPAPPAAGRRATQTPLSIFRSCFPILNIH
jgi:alpha-tubulin suppressor-like RCC1 family protein